MSDPHPILMHLGKPGQRANDIARALCEMIKPDREVGSRMDRVDVMGIDGKSHSILMPPRVWLDRLARAAERGAFERYSVNEITDRILTTEQAA